jgi:hypothetical protein
MGRRKTAGTSGRKIPDDVSTIKDVLSILIVVTLRAEEEAACWQSGHEGWAAASAARSTGEEGGGAEAETAAACRVLAAKVWTEDPEGTFTSVLPFAATLKPPEGEDGLASGWKAVGASLVPPELAATPKSQGGGKGSWLLIGAVLALLGYRRLAWRGYPPPCWIGQRCDGWWARIRR